MANPEPRGSFLRDRRLLGPVTLLIVAAVVWLALHAEREVTLASYATTLRGRTPAQKANALRAATTLDGTVLAPGQAFSFNRTVGPLSSDRGYMKAPVSYDGELVANFGGGVCQTSTTVYNAVLRAGLQVTERHRHFWPPRYAPPGADAAVAYPKLDLAVRNCLDQPVRLTVRRQGDHLLAEVKGRRSLPDAYEIRQEMRSRNPHTQVRKASARLAQGAQRLQVRGQDGFSVTTYRLVWRDGQSVRREIIAEDSYPPLNELRRYGVEAEE